jgi:hypothetical protein
MPAVDYSRLAALYDALVTDASDVEFFVRAAREARGPILELMAGTGRVTMPLARAGLELTAAGEERR